MHMIVVKMADLMKHLDNWFESAREDQWVPVNKKGADFMGVISEMLPEQSCAEMLIPVRSWETSLGFFNFLNWKFLQDPTWKKWGLPKSDRTK